MENVGLKNYRSSLGITIKEASFSVGVPLRTYIRYELNENYGSQLKRSAIFSLLKEKYEITEDKGLLSIEKIKAIVKNVLDQHEVEFCYLFGSYAKGYANEKSDVDLCISTPLTGLDFVALNETLRKELRKKVDLIRFSSLKDNEELIKEIMKDGIRIYE